MASSAPTRDANDAPHPGAGAKPPVVALLNVGTRLRLIRANSGYERVSDLEQLTLNPLVAPVVVLRGHPFDQQAAGLGPVDQLADRCSSRPSGPGAVSGSLVCSIRDIISVISATSMIGSYIELFCSPAQDERPVSAGIPRRMGLIGRGSGVQVEAQPWPSTPDLPGIQCGLERPGDLVGPGRLPSHPDHCRWTVPIRMARRPTNGTAVRVVFSNGQKVDSSFVRCHVAEVAWFLVVRIGVRARGATADGQRE